MLKLEKILKENETFPFPKLCQFPKSPSVAACAPYSPSVHQHSWGFPPSHCVIVIFLLFLVIPLVQTLITFGPEDPRPWPTSGCALLRVIQSACCCQISLKESMSENLFLIEIWASVHFWNHRKKLPRRNFEKAVPRRPRNIFLILTSSLPAVCEYSPRFFSNRTDIFYSHFDSFLKW